MSGLVAGSAAKDGRSRAMGVVFLSIWKRGSSRCQAAIERYRLLGAVALAAADA